MLFLNSLQRSVPNPFIASCELWISTQVFKRRIKGYSIVFSLNLHWPLGHWESSELLVWTFVSIVWTKNFYVKSRIRHTEITRYTFFLCIRRIDLKFKNDLEITGVAIVTLKTFITRHSISDIVDCSWSVSDCATCRLRTVCVFTDLAVIIVHYVLRWYAGVDSLDFSCVFVCILLMNLHIGLFRTNKSISVFGC